MYHLPTSLVTAKLWCGFLLDSQGADTSCALYSEGRSVGLRCVLVLTKSSHAKAGDFLKIVTISIDISIR